MLKKQESGRSMIEMLGVLAVIGVLSVAGIAGYTTAMRSYRTNEIVNAASMLYVMAMAQNAGNGASGDVTYASLNNGTNPSGVSSITYTNGSITITFNDPADCTMALNKLGDKATGNCADNKTLTVTLGKTEAGATPNYGDDLTTCDQKFPELNKCCYEGWYDCCTNMGGTVETEKCGGAGSDTCEINGRCYLADH